MSVSLAKKDEQLAALNEKIEKDEETRQAAEGSLNDSIGELNRSLREEERIKESLANEYEAAKKDASISADELEVLRAKLACAESQASATTTTVKTLENQVATYLDSQSELEAKLLEAEKELEQANGKNSKSAAAKAASQALSLLQMSAIEKAESSAAERARQLDEAENKLEELRMQVQQCKSSAQSAGEKAKLLESLQVQMEETLSCSSEIKAKLTNSEAQAERMRAKFEKRVSVSEREAEDARRGVEEVRRSEASCYVHLWAAATNSALHSFVSRSKRRRRREETRWMS